MKYILILITPFIFLISGCNNKDSNCLADEFSPNDYKNYLPYNIGDKLFFNNGNGNLDTIFVENYQLAENYYGSIDCFQETEAFECEVLLKYDSINSCRIIFFSNLERESPFLVVRSDDCPFVAVFASISNENAIITKKSNYHYLANTFNEVLIIEIDDIELGLEEIVLAKNHGFLFIKVDGITRHLQ